MPVLARAAVAVGVAGFSSRPIKTPTGRPPMGKYGARSGDGTASERLIEFDALASSRRQSRCSQAQGEAEGQSSGLGFAAGTASCRRGQNHHHHGIGQGAARRRGLRSHPSNLSGHTSEGSRVERHYPFHHSDPQQAASLSSVRA